MSDLKLTIIGIVFLFFVTGSLMAQTWKECSGIDWNYDLSGKRILTVIYEGFNYDEAVDISNYWKKWGARIDLAGTLSEQHGERNNPATGKAHDEISCTLQPDLLLANIDYHDYDLIFFPGGEGVEEFLKSNRDQLKQIIDGAVLEHKFVAAICHSPLLLAASELIKGHMVTIQGNEFKAELIRTGAKIVNEIFVSDGYYLTGQWPYFETFAVTIAEKLAFPAGNGPLEQSKRNTSLVLSNLLGQRNVFLMKPGVISDDTVKLMVRYSVNPALPFEMMNNSSLRFIAVKDQDIKAVLIDQLVESTLEKYKPENVPAETMRRLWSMIFNAPVILFIYNDLSDINLLEDQQDKEVLLRITTGLAGQSVSQLGVVANELGYGVSVIGGMRSLIAEEGFRKVLNVPEVYQLVNIVGIGRPLEVTNPAVVRPVDDYLIVK